MSTQNHMFFNHGFSHTWSLKGPMAPFSTNWNKNSPLSADSPSSSPNRVPIFHLMGAVVRAVSVCIVIVKRNGMHWRKREAPSSCYEKDRLVAFNGYDQHMVVCVWKWYIYTSETGIARHFMCVNNLHFSFESLNAKNCHNHYVSFFVRILCMEERPINNKKYNRRRKMGASIQKIGCTLWWTWWFRIRNGRFRYTYKVRYYLFSFFLLYIYLYINALHSSEKSLFGYES